MLKKILITLLIVPVIGAAIYGYFHFKQIKTPLSPLIQAIPSNAAVILKCNTPKLSLGHFSLSNEVWKELVPFPFFGEMHKDIRFLDGLFSTGSKALNDLQDKPLFISAHPLASNQYELLFLLNLPNTLSKKQVNDFIVTAAPKTASYNLRIYDGVALNEIKLTETESFYYFFNKGIFACTFSQYLMEDAIRQLNSGTPISSDPSFDKVWNAAGKKVEATLFLNFNYFSEVLKNIVVPEENKFTLPLASFANWSCLDIKAKNTTYQLTGFTYTKDTSNNYLNIFIGQEPQKIDITNQIPTSTAYFQCYALSDINRYFKNYDSYLNNLKDHFARQESLSKLNKKYGVNAQNFFRQWLGNQFAYVITEPENTNYEDNCYAVFKTNGNKDVPSLLNEFKSKIKTLQGDKDTIGEFFRGYLLQTIPVQSLIPLVFGDSFEKIKNTHFVLLNDVVIVANSAAALKKWINAIEGNHTLLSDKDYSSFNENTASQSTIYYYSALARSKGLFEHCFKKEVLNWDETKTAVLQKFHAVSFQLSANQNMFYSTLYAEYKPCYKKAAEEILETTIDTTLHTKPFIITDPSDSSKKLFVQDDANKIYLMDSKGQVLWKKEMKERIHSDVYSLRSRKEGKLQISFSTKTKIYLLDEEGDNVGKFPVVLKYIATNGVHVVDYDGNFDYRFLIAEENKRIYNYTAKGEVVNGWEAVPNSDKVSNQLSNFRVKGLDYLVVLDNSGNLNLLDRKGKSVVKFKQKFKSVYRNRYFIDIDGTLNSSSLVACDSTGLVTRLYFSGKLDKFQAIKTNQEFNFSYISGIKNYVFLTKNKLEIYNETTGKTIETKLELSALAAPEVIEVDKSKFKIIVSNPAKGLLYYSDELLPLKLSEAKVTTAPTACHFFGDASWYAAIGVGNKVQVFAVY
jgi:hypothetical protein